MGTRKHEAGGKGAKAEAQRRKRARQRLGGVSSAG